MHADRRFRQQLRDEVPAWVREGLVDAGAAQRLLERYPAPEPGTSLVTLALYAVGALLVGGGVISLVAWNWEALPAVVKLALVGGVLASVHVQGYRLWRFGDSPRLGHGLVFLGSVLFGAAIGLVAQVFHVSSNWYGGFGAWAAGALVAAWAYGSAPTGGLALALALTFLAGFFEDREAWAFLAPWAVAAAFAPLAWRLRAGALSVAVVAGIGATVLAAAGFSGGHATAVFLAALGLALLFVPAGILLEGGTWGALPAALRALGLAAFAVPAYLVSFVGLAEDLRDGGGFRHEGAALGLLLPLAAAGLLAAGAALSLRADGLRRRPWAAVAPAGALALGIAGLLPVPDAAVAVVANLALGALSLALVASALRDLQRGPFWVGLLMAGTLTVSRFLEFRADLLVKGLGFIACGVAVLLAGRSFERRLKARGGDHA